ncbi:hypothetical protein SAMN04487969_101114 [Paenibacillus algorifonticola]|uniref:Uncharacterized protein n=1 Tax=Paenibacillus algorifonticola TaxID=684063 RepID=A0A1I1XVL1_9BACL|nr:sigma-70 region 4 domain-containing protein [Paenibacillus algorifonticola]SFE11189.1 hypothetical protein SAMN04487969_101114 [Paenibacillus algorifonticola]
MKTEIVNKEELRKLFLEGLPLAEIAKKLGSTYGSIRTMIYHERQRKPHEWPLRINYPGKSAEPPLMMHLYECQDCALDFAVEDYEDADHSATVCPICHSDEYLQERGYGQFTVTSAPLREVT